MSENIWYIKQELVLAALSVVTNEIAAELSPGDPRAEAATEYAEERLADRARRFIAAREGH